jgi:twitching motility protein PilT
MMTMENLLRETAEKGASDLHLSAGEPPLLRFQGDLLRTERPPLGPGEVTELVTSIMTEPQRQIFEVEHEVDFAYELAGRGRFRVNVFVHSRGPGAVLRPIPTEIPSLDSLCMPAVLRELCTRERGLVLVTGTTGCGKSTTLAAMIDVINETWDAHILTVEDPIEFVHRPKRCLVNQREVGRHTGSFSNALRSAPAGSRRHLTASATWRRSPSRSRPPTPARRRRSTASPTPLPASKARSAPCSRSRSRPWCRRRSSRRRAAGAWRGARS